MSATPARASRALLHAACAIALIAAPAAAATQTNALTPTQHARVGLVTDHDAVRPGQTLQVGLRIVHDPGWHTYWINSGDSGLATRFDWTLPDGAQAGPIRWPFPERLPAGPLVNFGYSDTLLLPATLRVPDSLRAGERFRATLRARWLICAETCIPDEATLALDLAVARAPRTSAEAPAFAATLARVPEPLPATGHAWRDATHVAVQIDDAAWTRDAARIEVFPLTPQVVASTPIEARLGPDGALRFRHPASEAFDQMPARVAWAIGVHAPDGRFRAWEVALPGEDARPQRR